MAGRAGLRVVAALRLLSGRALPSLAATAGLCSTVERCYTTNLSVCFADSSPDRGAFGRSGNPCWTLKVLSCAKNSAPLSRLTTSVRMPLVRALFRCRLPRQRSTLFLGSKKLCSSSRTKTDTPVAPPLGELSPKVTERVRCVTALLKKAGEPKARLRGFVV